MSCSKCNDYNSGGCNCTSHTYIDNNCGCPEPAECSCKVYLSSDCINSVKSEFPCLGIERGLPLTQTLEAIDSAICDRINNMGESQIINVGGGAEVYKGVNLLGQKQLKTITSLDNSVVITSPLNSDTIDLSVPDVTIPTYTIVNEGIGAKVLDEVNSTATDFKLKSITSQNTTVIITEDVSTIDLNVPVYTVVNQGDGTKILDEATSTPTNFKIKTIVSDTLTILEEVNGGVSINIPEVSQIPALYVNNLYVPTYNEWVKAGGDLVTNPTFQFKGKGTSSQPFTDSIVYSESPTLTKTIAPNTAIQNSLDIYVGDLGSYSRLNPQLSGQQIIVQNNPLGYLYTGDFNYTNLNFKTESNIQCTLAGYAVDMDNALYFDTLNASVNIEVVNGVTLEFTQSLGFNNSGNLNAVDDFTSQKTIRLFGEGLIFFGYNGVNNLTRYIFNGNGNNNSGALHYEVQCKIRAQNQGVYLSKNKNRMDFYNVIESGSFLSTVNIALQAFHMTGGQIRFYDKGELRISSETSGRTYGVTFQPTGSGVGYCIFQMNSSKINYTCNYLFVKLNDKAVNLQVKNTIGEGATVIPGTSTIVDGLFENTDISKWLVEFKNNNFAFTGIDFNKVDLTSANSYSSINFIGNNIIETLVVYVSSEEAANYGIAKGSVFLKRVTVNAGSFIIGQEYRIATIGTTDFIALGASANTVGLYFTAQGTGTGGVGVGTAYLESRQILQ